MEIIMILIDFGLGVGLRNGDILLRGASLLIAAARLSKREDGHVGGWWSR